ncbi:MAG: hypothetical protein EOS60_26720 [Mesorhizobium sp.]|nr:MAG: hypothetical protein EOS60_26720 [Mesorhizobium sp.]
MFQCHGAKAPCSSAYCKVPWCTALLLQSGVDLLTIQAWLGHAQVATTHRYAAADVEKMRNGLEKAGIEGNYGARFRPTDAVLQLLNSI